MSQRESSGLPTRCGRKRIYNPITYSNSQTYHDNNNKSVLRAETLINKKPNRKSVKQNIGIESNIEAIIYSDSEEEFASDSGDEEMTLLPTSEFVNIDTLDVLSGLRNANRRLFSGNPDNCYAFGLTGEVVVHQDKLASVGVGKVVVAQQEYQINKYDATIDSLTGRACLASSMEKATANLSVMNSLKESRTAFSTNDDSMVKLLGMQRRLPEQTAAAVVEMLAENAFAKNCEVYAGDHFIPEIKGKTFAEKCQSMYDTWKALSVEYKSKIPSKYRNLKSQRTRFVRAVDESGLTVKEFLKSDCYVDVTNMTQLWKVCTANRNTVPAS